MKPVVRRSSKLSSHPNQIYMRRNNYIYSHTQLSLKLYIHYLLCVHVCMLYVFNALLHKYVNSFLYTYAFSYVAYVCLVV